MEYKKNNYSCGKIKNGTKAQKNSFQNQNYFEESNQASKEEYNVKNK
jgi:hypothetical protein